MQSLDVLLLNLPISTWYKDKLASVNSMPPLGILYIATYLQKNGYGVEVRDFSVEILTAELLKEMIREKKPKMIGISTYNESWKIQKSICKAIKAINPEIIVVAGGAFATFCYEDVLNESMTDYVIRGEGEYCFLDLCNALFREGKRKEEINIPGVCYKNSEGSILANLKLRRINDLDSLPFPDRDLLSLDNYSMPYTISTARGCPGNCIFCSSKAFWGKRVIMRSAKNVFDEVMYMHERYGTTIFSIADDTFTASSKRCKEFCKLLLETNIKFIWECESRADIVTEELIAMLYNAGCRKIQFGLESANNEILKKLKKNVTVEQIEYAVKCANKYDMHIQASYIIGHAFDTEETIKETIAFAQYLKTEYGARVVCSVNTPFPGTEQYDRREELGIVIHNNEWERYVLNNPIINTKNMTLNQLRYYLNVAQELIK